MSIIQSYIGKIPYLLYLKYHDEIAEMQKKVVLVISSVCIGSSLVVNQITMIW
jgi:hypothetical protein